MKVVLKQIGTLWSNGLADKGESSNATSSRRSLSEKKQRPAPLIYKLVQLKAL